MYLTLSKTNKLLLIGMQQMMHTYQLLQNKFWQTDIIAEKAGFINITEMTWHIENYYECPIGELRR